MLYVHIVIGLALIEFFVFGAAVGRARHTYNIRAPATTGHPMFERYFRVQMNTLEQLVIFVPAMLLFARYASPLVAAALGVIFIIGRALYFRGYVKDPEARGTGAIATAIPNAVLLLGGVIGAIWALIARQG